MSNFVPDGSAWMPDDQWQARKRAARSASQRTVANAQKVLAGQQRALSVRRPWANLIFAGKTIENRTWSTNHRGDLCVHAGQAWDPAGAQLAAELAAELALTGFDNPRSCAAGYLGLVRLVDVHTVAGGCCAPWGEPDVGIYHWALADPRPFNEPIPGRGRLGLYWTPTDLRPQDT